MLKPAVSPYPQRRCDRAGWFWIDLVVFWLASSAVNYALLLSIYDFNQPLTVALGTGASLLLSVLICYNKYTVIASVLAPLAGLAGLLAAMSANRGLCRWAMDFFPWVGQNMAYTDADKASPYFLPCALVIVFVATLVGYILAFQLRVMFAYLAGGGALCLIFYFTFDVYHIGHVAPADGLLYGLCAVLCCALYYLVRRQYAKTTRRLSFARSFVPFQRFFLPFIVITAMLSGMFAPLVLRDTYSMAWVNLVDWALTHGVPNGFLDSEFMSFYRDQTTLGGDINLPDDPLFTVASSAPVHLRAVVYDEYDGRHWRDTLSAEGQTVVETEPMSAHYHSTSTKELYRYHFSLDQPYVELNYDFSSGVNTQYPLIARTFTIKNSKLYTRSLFSTTYTKRATFLTSRNQVLISASSALLSNRRTRGVEDDYTVSYLEPADNTFQYYLRDSRYQSPRQEYLQLPSSLPDRVVQLSQRLTTGYSNPYAACMSISNYLTRSQTYTTMPGDLPQGVDFVDHFLFEDQRGYCVYYATAMVVLARASGYPARYVEGYRVDNCDAGRGVVVTGQNAHAWAEVYLDGVGWMTFDPVAANQFATNMRGSAGNLPQQSQPASSQTPSDASSNSQPQGPVSEPESSSSSEAPSGGSSVGWMIPILILCLAAAVLVCLIITRYAVYRSRYRRRLDGCPDDRVIPLYRELERALRRCRCAKPPNQTVFAYLTSLADEFERLDREGAGAHPAGPRDYAALCEGAARAVYAAAYSAGPPAQEDKQSLVTLTDIAEQRVKKKMGPILFALWWKQF